MPRNRVKTGLALSATLAVLPIAACAASSSGHDPGSSAASATASLSCDFTASNEITGGGKPGGSAPRGGKPAGGKPAGAPGGSSSQTDEPSTSYLLAGTSADRSGASFTATGTDQSAILVAKGGHLILTDPSITKSGNSKSTDESSFYGLNAAVLTENGGKTTITGGTVRSSGAGANAFSSCNSGSVLTLNRVSIQTNGGNARGLIVSGDGTAILNDDTIITRGQSSSDTATDRGGGTVIINGGTFKAYGFRSAGMYSTGDMTATDAAFWSAIADGSVIEGSNSITEKDSVISGGTDGVMIYQSMSGDAAEGTGHLTLDGGSVTGRGTYALYVTKENGDITIRNGAKLSSKTGDLLYAATDGHANLTLAGETLTGNVIVADSTSSATVDLTSGSALTGVVENASVTLGSTSTWIVSGISTVKELSGLKISAGTVTNIKGDGHDVYYSTSANPSLDGKTYTLAGGGKLIPQS
jgi:hypothetical protein